VNVDAQTLARVPLPSGSLASLGLGLSYPSHQQEVRAEATVFFKKDAVPTTLVDRIAHRPFLDFEAEVSLLLHREEPELFGYLMHNDLTDRKVQVQNYNPDDQAPGFALSKSFVGANAHGRFMAIGGADLWSKLEMQLWRNNELVQTVRPAENVMDPREIHRRVFADKALSGDRKWVIIGTGTPAGTIFRAPTVLQKLALFVRSGFRMRRAQELWLERFKFLQVGDRLEFRSETWGSEFTQIVAPLDGHRP
jgi:2-keto-4-pentenoate hydratase/2-oxohepta-3-ene-1,7-dioic acid hydratase in catechol pathway